MQERQPSGEDPANVNVSGGQGTQVGTGNVQYNQYSLRPPLDLADLSPHAGAARIRQLPHDDAVDLFAKALPDDLADKLKVLLHTDESKVVAILADLNPSKAAELISPLTDDFGWLADLPEAAAAIAQHAVELRWQHDAGTDGLERAAQSPEVTDGYFQQYTQGGIYWSDDGNEIYAVPAPIFEAHLTAGGTGGELGFPDSEVAEAESGPGTSGIAQSFEGGYILSSRHGIYVVPAEIADVADDMIEDWLGFPVSGPETGADATSQRFEGGVIYSSNAGTFSVRPDFDDLATDCFPVSDEEDVPSEGVPATATGRVQRFRGAGGREIAMYASSGTKARRVTGQRLALYDRLGGPGSGLGFPASATTRVKGGWVQRFEHGAMYNQGDREPVVVPAETVELAGDRLGWPVAAEESVGGRDGERIQWFENGVVTLREGKREIWLRPDSSAG